MSDEKERDTAAVDNSQRAPRKREEERRAEALRQNLKRRKASSPTDE